MRSNFGSGDDVDVSSMLRSVSEQFRHLQKWLLLQAQPDLRILDEFRDAINRLRQTAWALQQSGQLSADESLSNTVPSILAGVGNPVEDERDSGLKPNTIPL